MPKPVPSSPAEETMSNLALDVHGRARTKRLQMTDNENESSDDKPSTERVEGGTSSNAEAAASFHSADEASSDAPSLFSHSDNEEASSQTNLDDQAVKQPAKPDDGSSDESLFSHSDDSVSPAAEETTGAAATCNPPWSIDAVINTSAKAADAKAADANGCHDDSSKCSLFSRSRLQEPNCVSQPMSTDVAELTSPDHEEQKQAKYKTFEPPSYKHHEESDFESSDEESLFSLNGHDDDNSPDRPKKKRLAKQKEHLTSFGSPAIPRKKSVHPALSSNKMSRANLPLHNDATRRLGKTNTSLGSPAIPRKKLAACPAETSVVATIASTPVHKARTGRICDKFARHSSRGSVQFNLARKASRDSLPDRGHVTEKAKSKNRVSFGVEVKTPKFVARSARAMHINHSYLPLPKEEVPDSSPNQSTSEDEEKGIYFSWQKSYQEKQWNRDFLKVKKYIREHGGNLDVPEGHTLSDWIGRQQRICKRWLRNSYETREDVSDKEFQTFVHIFRLQKVGFEWGYRIDNRISGAILDWSSMLDPVRRKLLLKYDGKPSPLMMRVEAKAAVEDDVPDGDKECEFSDALPETKLGDTARTKRKRDRDVDIAKREQKRKNSDKKPTLEANCDFIDERPSTLSWNSTSRFQFTQEPISWNQLLEVYRKNSSTRNDSSTSSKQKWFGLEYPNSSETVVPPILAGPPFKTILESSEGNREEQPSSAASGDRSEFSSSTVDDTASKVKISRERGSTAAVARNDLVTDKTEPVKCEGRRNRRKCWFGLELASSPTKSVSKFQSPPDKSATNQQPSSTSVQETPSPVHAVTLLEPISPKENKSSLSKPTGPIEPVSLTENEKMASPESVKPVEDGACNQATGTAAVANVTKKDLVAAKNPRTKVTPRTTKAKQFTTSSAGHKHPTVSPKLAKIPPEPSKDFIGWSIRRIPKKKGAYTYYYSPHKGYQFRSKPEVKRFIKLMEEAGSEVDAIEEYSRIGKTQTNNKTPIKEKSATKNRPLERVSDSCTPGDQPKFSVGDEVYAAWWSSKARKSAPIFFAGTVKSVNIAEENRGRHYHIQYADGDELNDIDEGMVIPKDEYLHNNIKPIYDVGQKVYSAWWPGTKSKTSPSWYPGTIKGKRENPRGGRYGPLVLYDVLFDDGDEHFNVEDHFVFLHDDYLLATKQQSGDKTWRGVQNVLDKKSCDPWARVIGWYVATIDGNNQSFSLLSDALRAYDSHVVSKLGSQTTQQDLNLPEDWIWSKSGCSPILREGIIQTYGSKKSERVEESAQSAPLTSTAPPNNSNKRKQTSSLTVKQLCHVAKWNKVKSDSKSDNNKIGQSPRGEERCSEYDKKPIHKKGDKVYALWSGNTQKWYPGRIWDVNEMPSNSGYGPVRSYDVVYDDGETEKNIKEIFVMAKADYELCMAKEEKNWVGVKNVTDPKSEDGFARAVGWYEVRFEGNNHVFTSLGAAMRFYDESLIQKRGSRSNVLDSELNFPDKR